ncbi:MAG: class I SAM-dependent methyltransferase [Alphaproteobacteria bacterium]|nr:class I SAM-dependent methyltransferase [Alphaproteobacteria bacterium]
MKMHETEIEVKSPDGKSTLLLSGDKNSISVAHLEADQGVKFEATVDLQSGMPALEGLHHFLQGVVDPNSLTPITSQRLTNLGHRSKQPMRRLSGAFLTTMHVLLTSAEYTNFTYDLWSTSKKYLAHTTAMVTRSTPEEIQTYIEEAEQDETLHQHIRDMTAALPDHVRAGSDDEIRFGRRLGWYAVVRAIKPKFIIETGLDKGLGAVLLCAALKRNAEEGKPGRYLGTDINPDAGYLLAPPYDEFGSIAVGDSLESLSTVTDEIDVFVNDSDHSEDYEAAEYACIAPRLSDDAVVIGDNAHTTSKLVGFAEESGRKFLYWQEKPADHWYPGGGIGFAFR